MFVAFVEEILFDLWGFWKVLSMRKFLPAELVFQREPDLSDGTEQFDPGEKEPHENGENTEGDHACNVVSDETGGENVAQNAKFFHPF